jgi:hypothetical protein
MGPGLADPTEREDPRGPLDAAGRGMEIGAPRPDGSGRGAGDGGRGTVDAGASLARRSPAATGEAWSGLNAKVAAGRIRPAAACVHPRAPGL